MKINVKTFKLLLSYQFIIHLTYSTCDFTSYRAYKLHTHQHNKTEQLIKQFDSRSAALQLINC